MTDSNNVTPNLPNSPERESTKAVTTRTFQAPVDEQRSAGAGVMNALERVRAAESLLDQVDREAERAGDGRDENDPSEPSIEEYMAALLARSNARANGASPYSTQFLSRQELPAVKKQQDVEKPQRPADQTPTEKRTQKPAPERRDDLSSMRQLANLNARSALDTHSGRRLLFELHNKLTVAMVAVMLSIGLASIAPTVRSLTYLGAVAALLTSCVWTTRYLALTRRMKAMCAQRGPQSSCPEDDQDPSPAT
jgi:hypothetical protein